MVNTKKGNIVTVISLLYDITRYFLLYLLLKLITALGKAFTEKDTINEFIIEILLITILTIFIIFISRKIDRVKLKFKTRFQTILKISLLLILILVAAISSLYSIQQSKTILRIDSTDQIQSIVFAVYVGMRGGLEELFYRGVLFDVIKKNASILVTVFLTSILFTVAHTFANLLSTYALYIFALGFLCCSLRLYFNSVTPAIFFHLMWNFFAGITNSDTGFSPLLYVPALEASSQAQINITTSIIFILVSIVFLILSNSNTWFFLQPKRISPEVPK